VGECGQSRSQSQCQHSFEESVHTLLLSRLC
jgi:hypothetical protein